MLPTAWFYLKNTGSVRHTTVAMFVFSDHNINTGYQTSSWLSEGVRSSSHVCVSLVMDSFTSGQLNANYRDSDMSSCPGQGYKIFDIFMPAHFLCHTKSWQQFLYETSIAQSISKYFPLNGQEKYWSIYMFLLWLLLGICFGDSFHLCVGNTDSSLICAFYLNSMSTKLSMKQSQTLHSLEKKGRNNLQSIGKHESDIGIIHMLFFTTPVALGMARSVRRSGILQFGLG